MSKTYTVKQVASALGFSTNTVYKYLDEGKIKSTRLGKEGRFRIPEAEVVRLLQIKGERVQIAPNIDKDLQESRETAIEEVLPHLIEDSREKIEAASEEYNSRLAVLNKISNPDLFDWFLALTAIFLGVTYLLFPLHFQSISFEPYRLALLVLKIALVVFGIGLMVVDVFVPGKKFYHHLMARIPLAAVFMGLTLIFYQIGEHWSASYFLSLALFSVLPIVWKRGTFLKFVGFVYFLVVVSGWIWAKNPQAYIFADIREFVYANPQLFEVVLAAGATIFAAMLIFAQYRSQPLSILLSWILSGLFFLLSISFINDQSWNKAIVALMVGSFSLISPFYQKFDTLSKFNRKEVLISFSWLVLILLVGISVIYYTQTNFKAFVFDESKKRVETAVKIVSAFVDDSIKYTATVAQNPSLLTIVTKPKIDQDELEAFIKAEFQGATTLKRIVVINPKGNLLALYPPGDQEIASTNFSDREYFKQAVELKKAVVSEVIQSKVAQGTTVIVAAAPVLDDKGEVKAIVGGGIDASQLEDKLNTGEFGKTGSFALADQQKTIFIHEDKDLIGQKAILNANLIKAVEGESGQLEGYNEKGELSLQAYTYIPKVGWGIIAQQAVSEAFRQSSVISFTVFLITILSGVGALLVTLYLKRR